MNSLTKEQKRVLALSSLGGVLEFYDFIIYIFLAPIIEKVFFANSSPFLASLKTLAIFSMGYLLRPVGGIVFSHFGDRYGRKVVFMLTVVFMALPSFFIAVLPTTAQIGMAAPLLLLLLRMLQGLALGGEIPAAITFISEHAPAKRKAFSLSILFIGINTGLLLGSFMMTLLSIIWTEDQIQQYAWRFPFLLGGFFGLIAIYLRRYLHETKVFLNLQEKRQIEKVPAVKLLKTAYKQVLLGMLLVATGSVTVFLYLYWPQYLHQYLHYDFSSLMKINTLGTLALSFTIVFGGLTADKIGYTRAYSAVLIALLFLTYPLFYLFQFQNLIILTLSYFCFSLLFGFIPAAYSSILADLFEAPIRYSGIALSYNLAYAIFGGLSPILCTFFIYWFNSVLAPAFYVMSIALMSIIACVILDQRKPYLAVASEAA